MVMAVNGHVFHGRPIIVLLYTTLLSPPPFLSTLRTYSRYAAIESARISLSSLVCPFLLTQLHSLFCRENSWREFGISFVEIERNIAEKNSFSGPRLTLTCWDHWCSISSISRWDQLCNWYFERNFTKNFTNLYRRDISLILYSFIFCINKIELNYHINPSHLYAKGIRILSNFLKSF